jgi:hypothetical protein
LDDRISNPGGLGIFLFDTVSRPALGPTQPPIQWISEALSLGIKRPELEFDHSPRSNAEVKECVELYFHSLNTPSWRDAQLGTGGGGAKCKRGKIESKNLNFTPTYMLSWNFIYNACFFYYILY